MEIAYSDNISSVGRYAFAEIDKKVSNLKEKGVKVIDFGVGDPKVSPPDFVINDLSKYARNRALYGYPSYIGDISYRKICAEYMLREYNVNLDYNTEITSTSGSKEAVFHFPIAFINPGDLVICPTPGYPVYKSGTKFANGEVYFVPLLEENNFLIDFYSIPHEIANRAKILWINYPNSPCGVSATASWLRNLCDWAEKYNIIIAADEGCYNEIYFGNKPQSILEFKKDGVVVFYSLSKRNNMTGYRVGFIAGDSRIIEGYKKLKTNIDSGTPTFIQDAASAALIDQSFVKKMREDYLKKRNIMLDALMSCGLEKPIGDSTFYLWQKVPIDSIKFSEYLMELGIIVTPGELISENSNNGVNPGKYYVRFALVPTLDEINEAASIIKNNGSCFL